VSEPDIVPFLASFKLFEAMHEDEVFVLVLILLHGEGVQHLAKNKLRHEQYDDHRDIFI
jgi:hypothetical protein